MRDEDKTDSSSSNSRAQFLSSFRGNSLEPPGSNIISSDQFQTDGPSDDSASIQNREIGIYAVTVLLSVTAFLLLTCYLLFRCSRCCRNLFTEDDTKQQYSETVPSVETIPHPKRIYEIQFEEGCKPMLPTWPCKLPLTVQSSPAGLCNIVRSGVVHSANTSVLTSTSGRRVETGSLERLGRSKKVVAVVNLEPCVLTDQSPRPDRSKPQMSISSSLLS